MAIVFCRRRRELVRVQNYSQISSADVALEKFVRENNLAKRVSLEKLFCWILGLYLLFLEISC